MKKIYLFLVMATLALNGFAQITQVTVDEQRQLTIFDVMNDKSLSLMEIETFAAQYFSDSKEPAGEYKHYQRWLIKRKLHSDENGMHILPSTEQDKYRSFEEQSQNKAITVGNWTNEGPFTWNATSGWNPGNGRLMGAAIHPSRTNTIIVGSPDGGIWKTTDGGNSWQPRTDNNAARMNIRAVSSAPYNRTVFYAGTEDGIILKSTNSGSGWAEISSSTNGPTGEIRKILVHPSSSDYIIVCASNGIWKTRDDGQTWRHSLSVGQMDDIEYRPGEVKTLYASGDRLYKSTDWGNNWSQVSGIPTGRRTLISVSPDNPSALYVVQSKTDYRSFDKLYLTTNDASTFSTRYQRTSTNNNLFGFVQTDNEGQAFIHMGMDVNPTNWRDVHVAGLVTFRSTNAGSSFTQTSSWLEHDNPVGYTHSDITNIQFVGSTIFVTSDGGIYKSTNNGNDWTDLSDGLSIRTLYRMGSSLTDSNLYVGGCQDTGSFVHDSAGFRDWLGADGMEGLIHPTNNNWIFGTSQRGQTYWSGDRGTGQRVNLADLDGPWITPWEIGSTVDAGTGSAVMYAGTNNGIYKSTNGGGNYTKISPNSGSTALPGPTTDLTISHSNSNYIYASVGSTIYHSHNGGTNWYVYPATSMGSKGNITDIKVHPTNNVLIYFTTDNNSSSGGTVFSYNVVTGAKQNLSGNLPKFAFTSLVIDHDSPYRIYAAGVIGVYATDNNGSTWKNISSNMPKVEIRELDLQRSGHVLRVATYGRGIWEYSRASNRSLEEEEEIVASLKENVVTVFPNPATDKITVNLKKLSDVTAVVILNTSGVTRSRYDNIAKGTREVTLNVGGLNTGIYIVQIMNDTGIIETVNFIKK